MTDDTLIHQISKIIVTAEIVEHGNLRYISSETE